MNTLSALLRRRRRSGTSSYTPVATSFAFIDGAPTLTSFGATAPLRAAVLDQRGVPMANQAPYSIAYSSGTPANVTVNSSTGLCTAVANGTSVITASATGYTSLTRTATVSQQVASITGVSGTLSTDDASSGTFTPVGKDANNNTVSGATFSYATSNGSVVTVNASTGAWAGQSAGSATITITPSPRVSGYTFPVAVTVTHATVTPLTLSSVSPTTAVQGSSSTWTFFGTNINGTTVPVFSVPGDFTLSAYDYTNAPTSFTATVAVGGAATIGTDTVKLHDTSAAHTDSGTLNITVAAPVAPTFTSITPNTIAQNTSASYAIVGTNLNATQVLSALPTGVSGGAFTITDSSHASVTLTASATATTGAAPIKIHDPVNGDSGTQTLTVNTGTPSGTAVSFLNLRIATPTAHPSASKSTTLPLAKANGTLSTWNALQQGSTASAVNGYVQATLGTPQSNVYEGFVSPPLSAQIVPAQTITWTYGMYAESAQAWFAAPVIYFWRPSTDAVVGYVRDSATGIGSVTGAGNLTSGKVATVSLASPITLQDGDRLVLEWYAVGGGNDFVHHNYNGATTITEGSNAVSDGRADIEFASALYLAPNPMGTLRAGPTGISSGTGAIATVTVASDADYRSKMIPTGAGDLWDTTQTALNGTASPGVLSASEQSRNDLQLVDATVTFTDRDTVTRNTLHLTIKPNGGAPLSSAKDANAASSNVPQAAYHLPLGRAVTSWYHRRLVKFKPGFRLDCPNNTASNATGFNSTQSGAYKIGPHPANDVTRADLEITGGQNPGSEYMTANFGAAGTTPFVGTTDGNNYIIGPMSTIMPGWNTNGDVWEIVRVMRDHGNGTATQAVYIGKVTDTTLTRVCAPVCTLDTTKNTVFPAMNAINITGKNFNRQLASTDTFPELWVSDTEWADVTEAGWAWPTQIAVADRI